MTVKRLGMESTQRRMHQVYMRRVFVMGSHTGNFGMRVIDQYFQQFQGGIARGTDDPNSYHGTALKKSLITGAYEISKEPSAIKSPNPKQLAC